VRMGFVDGAILILWIWKESFGMRCFRIVRKYRTYTRQYSRVR
jgi:hypothetical protein